MLLNLRSIITRKCVLSLTLKTEKYSNIIIYVSLILVIYYTSLVSTLVDQLLANRVSTGGVDHTKVFLQ